jgi:hypothetical protein
VDKHQPPIGAGHRHTTPRPRTEWRADGELRSGLPAIAPIVTAAATTTTAAATTAATAEAATTAAAAATAKAATAAAAAATAEAAAARFALLGDVHAKRPAVQIRAVQLRDGFLRVSVAGHHDESEATRTARLTVEHERCLGHLAHLREGPNDLFFARLERKIAHVQSIVHALLSVESLLAEAVSVT